MTSKNGRGYMAYRKVDMIEPKEILLRIEDGQSKRKVRKVMGIHGVTLNRYLDIAKELGVDTKNPDFVSSDGDL